MRAIRVFVLGTLITLCEWSAFCQATNAPSGGSAAPPSAAAERSADDLQKLVAPIALYPDSLVATLLPASAYPLEIVQAARFVKDTNNISKLDAQPWDDNVKEIARFPDVIAQMNDNIAWTSDLGDAFINQPKGVTDAIQAMRGKAQQSGALKTTPQQVVVMTNTVVTNTVDQQIVYVTNEVVQIQPAQPDVVYVPQYNPTVVYGAYPAAYPGYYYPSAAGVAAAGAVSFGLGVAAGAIFANNCDWGHGGSWHGSYHSDVDINRNVNVNRNVNANRQKWTADQNRLRNSGSTFSSARSREARGWSPTSAQRGQFTQSRGASQGQRLSPTGPGASRPNVDRSPNVSRSSPNVNRPSPNVNRPSPNVSRPSGQNFNRPNVSQQRSAFAGGGGGYQARQSSNRGYASRGGGFRGGGGGRRR